MMNFQFQQARLRAEKYMQMGYCVCIVQQFSFLRMEHDYVVKPRENVNRKKDRVVITMHPGIKRVK